MSRTTGDLCIGLDVGTSGAKALLVAADGQVVAAAARDHPLLTPRPGWTEQEPEAWWQGCCECLRELAAAAPGRIVGLGSPARCMARCSSTARAG